VPANAGAVPITATLPETAGAHVAASLTAADGGLEEHDPLEGSPITSAEYDANCACVIASHDAAFATLTV